MKINKKFFVPFLGLTLITPLTSVVSCSSQTDYNNHYNEDDAITPPNNIEDDRTIETYLLNINWIQGFRDEKTSYLASEENFVFELNQVILDNNKFTIEYVGLNEFDKHNFSLFNKEINKFYLATIDAQFDQIKNKFSISNIKNYICDNLINNYQKNMIINHSISDDNFFIPIDLSDGSIIIEKNEITKLNNFPFLNPFIINETSLEYNINISSKKIREILFGGQEQNFQNFKIKDFNLKDLYILPMAMNSNDKAVSLLKYKINTIRNNDDYKNKTLTKDETNEINLEIPYKNYDYCVYTNQKINNKSYSGYVIKTEYINGISSSMNSIIDSNNSKYENIYERIIETSKGQFNSYSEQIINNGKRIKMDYKYDFIENKDSLVSFNINSKCYTRQLNPPQTRAESRSGNEMIGIYNIKALQKMSLNFTEYKKI